MRLAVDLPWGADTVLQAGLTEQRGTLGYEGLTQFGLPMSTATRLADRAVHLALRREFRTASGLPTLAAHIGLEWGRTVRDIEPTAFTGALSETLRRLDAALGVGLHGRPLGADHPWSLELDLAQRQALDTRLDINTHGAYDPLRLVPRGVRTRRLALTAGWDLDPGWRLLLGWQQESRTWKDSEAGPAFRSGRLVTLAQYPGSEARLHGWFLGARLRLCP